MEPGDKKSGRRTRFKTGVPPADRTALTGGALLVDDLEILEHDRHIPGESIALGPAVLGKKADVALPPGLQIVVLPFAAADIEGDVAKRQNGDGGGLDDAAGRAGPIGDDRAVADLRQRQLMGSKEVRAGGGGPFLACQHQLQQLVGPLFAVVEVIAVAVAQVGRAAGLL